MVLFIQRDRSNLGSVSQQVNSHLIRTITKYIVIVLPFLGDLNFSLFGCMSIGKGCNSAICRIASQCISRRHIFFSPGVADRLSACILRQILDSCGPVIVLVERHFCAVAQDNSQACRTNGILVFVIVPDLLNSCFGLCRSMSIRDGVREGSFPVRCDSRLIACYLVFSNRIGNIGAAGFLIKFTPAVSPAIALVQFNSRFFCTVSQQSDRYFVRTDAILVSGILPNLLHGYFGVFRYMRIRYVILEIAVLALVDGDFGFIMFHRFFFNGVNNNLTLLLFLGQLMPGIGPLIALVQRDALDLLSVCQQVNRYRLGPVTILIVCVIPDLGDSQFSFFAGMTVCHVILEVSCFILVFGNTGCIVCHRILCHGVNNFYSVLFLLQAGEGITPAVAFIQFGCFAGVHAVSQQLDDHFIRPVAILVFIVFPDLVYLNLGLFSFVIVCNMVLESAVIRFVFGDGRCVLIDRVFLYCITDVASVFFLRKIGPGISPAVFFIQFDVCNLRAVFQQVNRNFFRLVAILVVGIIPDLQHLDLSLCRSMAVCQRSECALFSVVRNGVSAGYVFTPGIVDFLAVIVFPQVFHGSGPTVRLAQSNGRDLGIAVHQVHSNAVGADAVLVAVIGPFLLNRYRGLCFCIGDGYLSASIAIVGICRRTKCRSFYYIIGKIIDRTVRFIEMTRKCIPFILPVVACVQDNRLNNGKLLVSNDLRNRLQSTLDRSNRIGGIVGDIGEAGGRDKESRI